tara:strand:- start:99 stop:488 length:390 start_codon:yes stop_codon:yes gene_type:complete
MAIQTSNLTDLASKLIVDIDADTSEAENVTGATTGKAYIVEIDATAGLPTTGEPACYVKIANAQSITGGGGSSTVPTITFYAPIGVVTTYVISNGWEFDDGLSFWCVTTAALSGDDSPTADIKVSIVSS